MQDDSGLNNRSILTEDQWAAIDELKRLRNLRWLLFSARFLIGVCLLVFVVNSSTLWGALLAFGVSAIVFWLVMMVTLMIYHIRVSKLRASGNDLEGALRLFAQEFEVEGFELELSTKPDLQAYKLVVVEARAEDLADDYPLRLGPSPRLQRWLACLPPYRKTFDDDAFRVKVFSDDEKEAFVDDTLFDEDVGRGGDGVDSIIDFGIETSLEVIDEEPQVHSIEYMMTQLLLSIESVAACAGVKSQSRELERLRAWGETYNFTPPQDLVEVMLERVDCCIKEHQEFPEKYRIPAEHFEETLKLGVRMRERIATLLES